MKIRGLLAAAIILAALAGVVYWSNHHKPKEAASSSTTPKILSQPESGMKKIEIKRKSGEDTVLERNASNQWEITSPKKYGVDTDAVSSLTSTLSDISSDRLIDEKTTDLGQYGLADPSLDIVLTQKNGKAKTLLIGDDAPTGSSAYAKLQNDPRIFTIASFTKSGLDKTAKDLRDKRLLTFDSDKLSRVELEAKKADIEFGRVNQNQWQILKPKPLRADSLQVEELIRKLKEAKMDLTVSGGDAKKAESAFASGTPVATAKVTDPSGTQELQVRKDKGGDYYAKSSVVEGVYKVTSDLGQGLDKNLDDFRNKKLFDFGFNDPKKIEMQAGAKSYSFTKSGDNWMSNGKKMDSISLESFLDKLRELSADKFVDSGFGPPTINVSVTDNDGKTVEKVSFAKQGADYIGKRENESTLYQIAGKNVDDLETSAADVKPAPPAKK